MFDERLRECLRALAPHVDRDALALTGGVALAHHCPGSRDALADIDFVAQRMDAVRPSLTTDFLISHRHVAPDSPMVQIVDPRTRLRIDIFADRAGSVARAEKSQGWRVIAAGDLLAHKRTLLARPVDPKHWRDVELLSRLLGEQLPPAPVLAVDVYCRDPSRGCERCVRALSPDFPLGPKAEILRLLGYV